MSTNGLAYMVLANSETGEGMIASRGSTTQDTGSTGLVPRYVIVSPVRDEQDNIERAIQCVMRQSVRPTEWIIVNDGSRDQTGRILDEYSIREPWIRVIHRKDRGYRKSGTGVMEAFHDGYGVLQTRDWDFLVKLDGDLSFTEDYFALCFKRFQQNPKLGLGGGTILSQGANGLASRRCDEKWQR